MVADPILKGRIDEASSYIEKLCSRIEAGVAKPPVAINTHKTLSMLRKHSELVALISSSIEKELM